MMPEIEHRPRNGWRGRPLWLGLTLPVAAAGILIFLLFLFVGAASRPWMLPFGPQFGFALSSHRHTRQVGKSPLVAPEQTLVYTLTVTNISGLSSTVSLVVTAPCRRRRRTQGAIFLFPSGGSLWNTPLGGTASSLGFPVLNLHRAATCNSSFWSRWQRVSVTGRSSRTLIMASGCVGRLMGMPVTVTVQAPALAIGRLLIVPRCAATSELGTP